MSEAPHVLVLGTGGAGFTAALSAHETGARVSLFEEGDQVGGTTAWSGGMIWIPNNHHEATLGVEDNRAKALTYLMSMSHGLMQQHAKPIDGAQAISARFADQPRFERHIDDVGNDAVRMEVREVDVDRAGAF